MKKLRALGVIFYFFSLFSCAHYFSKVTDENKINSHIPAQANEFCINYNNSPDSPFNNYSRYENLEKEKDLLNILKKKVSPI